MNNKEKIKIMEEIDSTYRHIQAHIKMMSEQRIWIKGYTIETKVEAIKIGEREVLEWII